jgi:pimeloyl-ACP methyl ester carboxylesterase
MPYVRKSVLYVLPVLSLALFAFARPSVAVAKGENPCGPLRNLLVPASEIGLPTSGAMVTSSSHHHKGSMAYCRIMGRIHPVDPNADDIRFELNLPDRWNTKALQYGGGTFDGYLAPADGLGRTAVGEKSEPVPLERGYATFGSDSGHHRSYFPFPDAVNALNAKFARNSEMQRNFAGDALKKVHDTVSFVMKARYGHLPQRMYFIGGSTGGREALRVAQRFPSDYDGVLAAYAAWDQVELDLQFMRTAQALYAPGGFLGGAQTKLIERTVQKTCDAEDGLRDGMISDPSGCHVQKAALLCEDGKRHHGCLSAAQWHTLETFATPQQTEMPLSGGVDSIPGYNVLSGASLNHATGLLPFPLHNPVFLFSSFGYVIGDDVTRNFLTVGHHFNALTFDTRTGGAWQDELIHQGHEIDSTNVNLQPFFAHGGKLILVHGTEDNIIPTNSSVDYYQRLKTKLGDRTVEESARLYLVPGLGHGFGRFAAGFDTIGTLDAWVDRGVAPLNLVVTDNHSGRTRPLCQWPEWPRYNGSGDVNSATSFTCTQSASAPAPLQASTK